jgi:hypothetical protein
MAISKLQQMYRYPAVHKLADYHRLASQLGYSDEWVWYNGERRKPPPCACCDRIINTHEIPLCYSTLASEPRVGEDKFVLPLGVSIFFSFIKMIALLLLFRFLIFDLFVMITSNKSNYC